MNPLRLKEAKTLVLQSSFKVPSNISVVLFPPSLFFSSLLPLVRKKKNVSIGLQNIFPEEKGAYTGEISARMAFFSGVEFVLVGHSERRAMGESNLDTGKKLKATLALKMIPIFCFGERERNDHGGHFTEIKTQLEEALSEVTTKDISKIIFAYEPIWAIGKSAKEAMTPHEFHEVSLFLRKVLHEKWKVSAGNIRILYGGSVEPANAPDFLLAGDIDGFLVGHKSLEPKSFQQIIDSASSSAFSSNSSSKKRA